MRPLARPSAASRTRYWPTRKRARATASTGSSARRRRRNRLARLLADGASRGADAPLPARDGGSTAGREASRALERRSSARGTSGVGRLAGGDFELGLLEQILGVALLVAMRREVRKIV